MSKEITLEQLAASSKGNQPKPESKVVSTEPVNRPKVHVAESPSGGAVRMNPAQVASQLTKAGVMQEKKENIVEAPLVEDAFKAMDDTLKERKEWIQNTMMPIVEENARQMAAEREFGEDALKDDNETAEGQAAKKAESKIVDIDENDFLDDGDKLSDDEDDDIDFEKEDQKIVSNEKPNTPTKESLDAPVPEKHYNIDQSNIPAEAKEDEKKVETPKVEKTTSAVREDSAVEEESGTLDDLINDIDKDDSMNVVDDEEETPEEIRERFKEKLDNVKITSDPIDLGKYKIRKEAVNSNFILNTLKNSRVVKKADWGLYHSKRSMTFLECSGPELDTLRKNIANSNGMNGVIISLRFIYDHVEDANKPSFEQWTKLIRTEDIESLYYGIYRACYADSNLVPRQCTNEACKKTSLIDTNIDDMVEYGDENDDHEKIRKEFLKIVSKDTTTETNVFESTLMQVSDNIVISYAPATLYSTFIQYASLKQEIYTKYNDLLNTLAYIDGFFTIDRKSQELIPISIKEYPGNLNKTILSRLKVYTEILKTLTNDQYNVMITKLNNMIGTSKILYVLPECKCPECGEKIAKEPVESMLNMLFTRAQLAQIKSM